jgi:replicative DNA helicase
MSAKRPPLAPVPDQQPEPRPVVLRYVADIIRSESYQRSRQTFPTGIKTMDEKIAGGLKSRQQSILAAPTGTGKTGLSGTIMIGLAALWIPILWICTELADEEQAARFVALARRRQLGGCYSPDDMLSHMLPPEEQAQLVDGVPIAIERIRRRDLDPFGRIEACANTVAEKHGKQPIICVDYLQKLANTDTDQLRVSVGDVSEQLLDIADRLDTHVLAISSVSRAYYSSTARKLRKQNTDEDPRDWLAAAKESGSLEYDAALMMFLHVGDNADVHDGRPARLIVAKSRQGGEGFYGLRFHGPSGLFIPDDAAADELKPTEEKKVAPDDLRKIQTEIRRLIMKRKKPFTSQNQIYDRIKGNKASFLAAIDEMFEAGELTQEGRGKPIAFAPPSNDNSNE